MRRALFYIVRLRLQLVFSSLIDPMFKLAQPCKGIIETAAQPHMEDILSWKAANEESDLHKLPASQAKQSNNPLHLAFVTHITLRKL